MFERLALSGEPLIKQLKGDFPNGRPNPPISAIQVEKAVLQLRDYRAEYQDCWMSTASTTRTGGFGLQINAKRTGDNFLEQDARLMR